MGLNSAAVASVGSPCGTSKSLTDAGETAERTHEIERIVESSETRHFGHAGDRECPELAQSGAVGFGHGRTQMTASRSRAIWTGFAAVLAALALASCVATPPRVSEEPPTSTALVEHQPVSTTPTPEPSVTPEPEKPAVLTSLFQTAMGYDAVGMMVIEGGAPQTVGGIAFDIPDWWKANITVPGGYAELTYFGDSADSSLFGFAVGQPPCDGDMAACVADRIDTLTGGNQDAYGIDAVQRESLPDGGITLLSQRSSGADNGWIAVVFVSSDTRLYEFLIGDTGDLASVLASIDSVRPA